MQLNRGSKRNKGERNAYEQVKDIGIYLPVPEQDVWKHQVDNTKASAEQPMVLHIIHFG